MVDAMMNTLYEAVAHRARSHPEAIALAHGCTLGATHHPAERERPDRRPPGRRDHADGRVSYRALHQLASRAAAGLRANGIAAGDVIAVQLPNSLPFVVTLLAAGALGATVQMLHMPYRRAELSSLLRHGGASAYVGLARFKNESPLATVADLGLVRLLVTAGNEERGGEGDSEGKGEGDTVRWSALLRGGEQGGQAGGEPPASGHDTNAFAAVDPDSRYVLLHTSGTTADPKGVPVSHRQFIGNAAASLQPLQVSADDVLLTAAPFSHLYGLFVLEMGLLAGACVSLLPAFTPADLVATVRRDRVSAIFAGPAHFRPLLKQPDLQDSAFAGLRLICLSGTAVAQDLAQAVESLMPRGKVIQLWGMSELQAGSYGRPDDAADIRHKTAGRPSPGTELRIRVQGQQAVQAGTEGQLQVRGPSLFTGYLDNPQATEAAFDDGWFNTGDTGYLSADGALVLTGRTKEIINRGGVKFSPLDVEAVIDGIPGVVRSCVVPMPDPVLGERACVFVQTDGVHAARADGAVAITLGCVLAELERAGIARFKWPERLELIDEMPMTPTQKVMRGRLAARLTQQ